MLAPLEQLIPIVRRIAREELMPRFACCTRGYKDDGSILTEADMTCHHHLKRELAEYWPDIGYLSEECGHDEQQELLERHADGLWVVDPLDGTNNFASGIPYFCLSLALVDRRGVRLGVVYDPNRDECFTAEAGSGAFLNGERLPPRGEPPEMDKSLLLANLNRLPVALRDYLIRTPPYGSVRHFGASALDWCWLADGRGHLLLHAGQNFWDYAAGLLIFSEAGGCSCTLEGQDIYHYGLGPRSVIAADSLHFEAWRDQILARMS